MSALPIVIRPATPEDAETIAGFNAALAEETEDKHLDRPTLLAGVAALLARPERGRYWLACRPASDGDDEAGAPIGQVAVTYEWSDWRNGNLWWLQSVYVAKDARRQGVFARLLAEVAAAAEADPEVAGLRLYVERDNTPAQATYTAAGFQRPGYLVMERLFSR